MQNFQQQYPRKVITRTYIGSKVITESFEDFEHNYVLK